MQEYRTAFVGIDAAKSRHAVAVAEGGRGGEVRYLGEVDGGTASIIKTVQRIAARYDRVQFCYEAGPTGYGLQRLIASLGHDCMVVAPSLIPRRPGDRVKTNRRDAVALARLLRADELTAVWVPSPADEAMRDLVRARHAAVEDLRACRQQVAGFFLRQDRKYPGKKGWTLAHLDWIQRQAFDYPAHRIAVQEMLHAVRNAKERQTRLERAIETLLADWPLAPIVRALQALRGVELIVAVTFVAELGDVRRFPHPRKLMAYLGLVCSQDSTGDKIRLGAITKAGNSRVRQMLIQSAWTYRHPPRVSRDKQARLDQVSPEIRQIAWKAQTRLTARFRALLKREKRAPVVCTAIARELAGFMWIAAMKAQ